MSDEIEKSVKNLGNYLRAPEICTEVSRVVSKRIEGTEMRDTTKSVGNCGICNTPVYSLNGFIVHAHNVPPSAVQHDATLLRPPAAASKLTPAPVPSHFEQNYTEQREGVFVRNLQPTDAPVPEDDDTGKCENCEDLSTELRENGDVLLCPKCVAALYPQPPVPIEKCGKFAGSLVPRLGLSYVCALDKGHDGDCERGGTCFTHGAYVGENCPHWPICGSSVTTVAAPVGEREGEFEKWWEHCALRQTGSWEPMLDVARIAWNAALASKPSPAELSNPQQYLKPNGEITVNGRKVLAVLDGGATFIVDGGSGPFADISDGLSAEGKPIHHITAPISKPSPAPEEIPERPKPFYYEDYDTKSDPEYLFEASVARSHFGKLEAIITTLRASSDRVREERDRLDRLINTPSTSDFLKSVELEAAHQVTRWAVEHDAGKADSDWFWLIGYLAGKVLSAPSIEKKLHHIITTAAVCLNWHRHITGEITEMRPGIAPPDALLPTSPEKV